jgi:hypothetical protein
MTFRYDHLVVFQIQLARKVDVLPLTRDYMSDSERAMRFVLTEHHARANEAA